MFFYSLTNVSKGDKLDDEKLEILSNNLDSIVKNIQFQDLVSQKIENISNSLKTLQGYSDELIRHTKDKENILPNNDYIERIIRERTLEEMRSNMLRNLENVSKVGYEQISDNLSTTLSNLPSSKHDGDDIELF